jgi:hypothetical protein
LFRSPVSISTGAGPRLKDQVEWRGRRAPEVAETSLRHHAAQALLTGLRAEGEPTS